MRQPGSMHGGDDKCVQFWPYSLKERDKLKDTGFDGNKY
jgi:hypothetical protein